MLLLELHAVTQVTHSYASCALAACYPKSEQASIVDEEVLCEECISYGRINEHATASKAKLCALIGIETLCFNRNAQVCVINTLVRVEYMAEH